MTNHAENLKAWVKFIERAPDDPVVKASILCRLAARLWVDGGGSVQGFVAMADAQASAEAHSKAMARKTAGK